MIALPNPFLNSVAPMPSATDAVASTSSPAPVIDAAAPQSSMAEEAQETPVVDEGSKITGATDLLGSPIDNVGEIFLFAKILCAQARLRPGTISPEAVGIAEEISDYEDVYRDPPPLFLRHAGYRR